MPSIELVLAKAGSLDEELSLFFELYDTPIAKKYEAALNECEQLPISSPDRFYGFPNDPLNRTTLAERINQCVDAINAYAPGVIPLRAEVEMSQDRLNHLHHYFEILRGPILSPPEFMIRAPLRVKLALEHLNLAIHHFEEYERNEQILREGGTPAASIVLTFDKRARQSLADEDFQHFTRRQKFGSWTINYCEVGKPIWDVYQDKDEVIGSANVRPLSYYSADAKIDFGATMTDAEYEAMMASFDQWWQENRVKLQKLGFKKGDPRNAIGSIPVAELARDRGVIAGKSEDEIRTLIGDHQYLSRVACHGDAGRGEVRRLFENRIRERLARRPDLVRRINATYQFRVSGEGGGSWVIDLTRGATGYVGQGSLEKPNIEVKMTARDLIDFAGSAVSTHMAIVQGKLQFEGSMRLALELRQLLG